MNDKALLEKVEDPKNKYWSQTTFAKKIAMTVCREAVKGTGRQPEKHIILKINLYGDTGAGASIR